MISFIIPAHNEEAWVGRCVSAIRSGLEALGEPHEIIVVDDASTDATASIAQQLGAQVDAHAVGSIFTAAARCS